MKSVGGRDFVSTLNQWSFDKNPAGVKVHHGPTPAEPTKSFWNKLRFG